MRYIEASYDGQVLRPSRGLELRAGQRVRLAILVPSDPRRWDLERLADSEDEVLAKEGLAEWADELEREDRR